MTAADLDGNGQADLIVSFPGAGIWVYRNNATWTFLHAVAAPRLTAGDLDGSGQKDLVIDFGASFGVWAFSNNVAWTLLHSLTTEGLTAGDMDGNGQDDVLIDFGAPGMWLFKNAAGWQSIHTLNPKAATLEGSTSCRTNRSRPRRMHPCRNHSDCRSLPRCHSRRAPVPSRSAARTADSI